MYIFDELRRQNKAFYTTNPILQMDEKELTALAEQMGMSVEEVKRQATILHFSMTCPLCGRPQSHLSNCKGCGTGAYTNWDFDAAHGDDATQRLKTALQEILGEPFGDRAKHAAKHAYDCMVCASCWQETIRTYETFHTCPLKMFADRILTGEPPQALVMAVRLQGKSLEIWLQEVYANWITEHPAARWRETLVKAALLQEKSQQWSAAKKSPTEKIAEIEEELGLEEE